jgi:hypothetical protein
LDFFSLFSSLFFIMNMQVCAIAPNDEKNYVYFFTVKRRIYETGENEG